MEQITNEGKQSVVEPVRSTLTEFIAAVQQTGGVYHLNSDITLTSNVTMASKTMIIFEGGKIIGNYTLTGNRSTIVSPPRQIFSGITLAGTWNVNCCYAEWWGAVGNGSTNDAPALQSALSSPFEKVVLLNKTYAIKSTLVISDKKTLEGTRQSNSTSGTPLLFAKPDSSTSMSSMINISSDFVTLRNLTVKNTSGYTVEYGIQTTAQRRRLLLEGVCSAGCSIGYYLYTNLAKIERCTAIGVFTGFYVKGGSSTTMINCFVKTYHQNAYFLESMTYSSLMNCCADTLSVTSIAEGGPNWYIYYIKLCNSLSMVNCGGEEAAKGVYIDGGSNISINNCWFYMPLLTTPVGNGKVLFFLNSSKIDIDGLYISNWICTGWVSNSSISGWFNENRLIWSEGSNGSRNTIRLHNVYYRGYDRDKGTSGYTEVKQNLSSKLIGIYNGGGTITDVVVEYDWVNLGTNANRPTGLDSVVGAGFHYYNTTSNKLEIWDGSSWQIV